MSKNIGTNVKDSITIEIEELIKKLNLKCSVEDFPSKVDWDYISRFQKLSESFIEKFKDRLDVAKIPKENIIEKTYSELMEEVKNRCLKILEQM